MGFCSAHMGARNWILVLCKQQIPINTVQTSFEFQADVALIFASTSALGKLEEGRVGISQETCHLDTHEWECAAVFTGLQLWCPSVVTPYCSLHMTHQGTWLRNGFKFGGVASKPTHSFFCAPVWLWMWHTLAIENKHLSAENIQSVSLSPCICQQVEAEAYSTASADEN